MFTILLFNVQVNAPINALFTIPKRLPVSLVDASFEGKSALVTGSSSGIGAAIARELAQAGVAVAVHYRGNSAGAQGVVDAIRSSGGRAELYQADISNG